MFRIYLWLCLYLRSQNLVGLQFAHINVYVSVCGCGCVSHISDHLFIYGLKIWSFVQINVYVNVCGCGCIYVYTNNVSIYGLKSCRSVINTNKCKCKCAWVCRYGCVYFDSNIWLIIWIVLRCCFCVQSERPTIYTYM